MPIYEYRCESCGHELEALQKISDPLLTQCPQCKAEALKKKVSAAGFRLKGGGWYETDFKSGNKKNVAGDKTADDGKSKDKSTAKADGDKKSDGAKDSAKKDSAKSDGKSGGGGKDSKSKGGSANP